MAPKHALRCAMCASPVLPACLLGACHRGIPGPTVAQRDALLAAPYAWTKQTVTRGWSFDPVLFHHCTSVLAAAQEWHLRRCSSTAGTHGSALFPELHTTVIHSKRYMSIFSSSLSLSSITSCEVSCSSPVTMYSSRIAYTLWKLNTRSSSQTLPKYRSSISTKRWMDSR